MAPCPFLGEEVASVVPPLSRGTLFIVVSFKGQEPAWIRGVIPGDLRFVRSLGRSSSSNLGCWRSVRCSLARKGLLEPAFRDRLFVGKLPSNRIHLGIRDLDMDAKSGGEVFHTGTLITKRGIIKDGCGQLAVPRGRSVTRRRSLVGHFGDSGGNSWPLPSRVSGIVG
jgi:hypothetical protein